MCNIEPVYLKSSLDQCKVHTRKNPFMHKLEGWEMWVTGHLKTLEFRFVVKKNSWKRSPRLFIRIIEAQTGSNTLCDKKYNTPYNGRLFFPTGISTWKIVDLLFFFFQKSITITDLPFMQGVGLLKLKSTIFFKECIAARGYSIISQPWSNLKRRAGMLV